MPTTKKAKATASKVVTKVTRKFVAKLDEFAETRSLSNLYEKLVKEGRSEILAEVGEEAQSLVHNGVEVAVIAKVTKPFINLDKLKRIDPEAYEACLEYRDEFHIRKAK